MQWTTTQASELNECWRTTILVDKQINLRSDRVRWSCACRILESAGYHVQACDSSDTRVRDLALVRFDDVGRRSSLVDIHGKKMRVYPDVILRGAFGNRYASGAVETQVANTEESGNAFGAEYGTQSLLGSLFCAIGFGLGIAGLCVMALTLALAPVLVVEPNQWIRDGELFWIGVGLVALVAELLVTKR